MGLFYPGALIIEKDGRLGVIIEDPQKKPLVGYVYKVLFSEGVEWVYPERMDPAPKAALKKERLKSQTDT